MALPPHPQVGLAEPAAARAEPATPMKPTAQLEPAPFQAEPAVALSHLAQSSVLRATRLTSRLFGVSLHFVALLLPALNGNGLHTRFCHGLDCEQLHLLSDIFIQTRHILHKDGIFLHRDVQNHRLLLKLRRIFLNGLVEPFAQSVPLIPTLLKKPYWVELLPQ
uniref:Uncharacterized protein n=1 Tax=Asparagus officinalis TaxID=4686 RepID=Q2AA68_ASPOF|nr:hypothetical protein 18.t00023 [Asparagus officinalis]